jgi:hypothetical protein
MSGRVSLRLAAADGAAVPVNRAGEVSQAGAAGMPLVASHS